MKEDNKNTPKVDKASLEASKKKHQEAISNNKIIKKDEDNRNTQRPKR